MKEKNKPTVTYIKKGVEKTINLNFLTKRILLKQIIEISRDWHPKYEEFTYDIKKDIEFVHFKNCSFVDLGKLKSSDDTLCIFEDCTFMRRSDYCNDISFTGGTYELIDPIFKNITAIQRYKDSAVEISILYKKQNKETTPSEKLRINNISRRSVSSTNIEDNCNFEEILLDGKNVKLSKQFEVEYINLDNDEIAIGNKKTDTDIKVKWGTCRINAEEKVNLTNCTINNTDGPVYIYSPEVEIENATLKARGRIKINDTTYNSLPNESQVTVTDKDITRANLISALKAYQNKLNKQIRLQKYTILEPKYKELQRKEIGVTKSLSRKKVTYFTKK